MRKSETYPFRATSRPTASHRRLGFRIVIECFFVCATIFTNSFMSELFSFMILVGWSKDTSIASIVNDFDIRIVRNFVEFVEFFFVEREITHMSIREHLLVHIERTSLL